MLLSATHHIDQHDLSQGQPNNWTDTILAAPCTDSCVLLSATHHIDQHDLSQGQPNNWTDTILVLRHAPTAVCSYQQHITLINMISHRGSLTTGLTLYSCCAVHRQLCAPISNTSQLEIWGKAQLKAARCSKSDWKYNLWG